MLKFSEIIVTQDSLRNAAQLPDMVEFLTVGGIFNKEAMASFQRSHPESYTNGLIQLVQFEDGKIFVHDGHHRMVAMHLARRNYLYESEYEITQWTYEQYEAINFEVRWVTPYHPGFFVRLPDYRAFKKDVDGQMAISQEAAAEFIRLNKHKYCKPRNIWYIEQITKVNAY